jgi:hypothetical protein
MALISELPPRVRRELRRVLEPLEKKDPCARCTRSSPERCPKMDWLRAVPCREGFYDSLASQEDGE